VRCIVNTTASAGEHRDTNEEGDSKHAQSVPTGSMKETTGPKVVRDRLTVFLDYGTIPLKNRSRFDAHQRFL
jgi:hypothetical protein